jgi:hypothetical protein
MVVTGGYGWSIRFDGFLQTVENEIFTIIILQSAVIKRLTVKAWLPMGRKKVFPKKAHLSLGNGSPLPP